MFRMNQTPRTTAELLHNELSEIERKLVDQEISVIFIDINYYMS